METTSKKLTKKDLMSVFWRSFALMGAMNYQRMQGLGYSWSLAPSLKKIWHDTTDFGKALLRHMAAFNCATAPTPFIMGVSLSMEEQYATNPEEFDEASINSVKVALMGPLAGIGDVFFWGVFRVVFASIGVSIALQGSALGALLFLILYNIPNLLVRYFGLMIGYEKGRIQLAKWSESGILSTITRCASIIGITVIAGMIASSINISTPLTFEIQGSTVGLQETLDQILPKLLPFGVTLLIYNGLKKASVNKTMLVLLVVGFILGVLGIL